MIEAKGEEAEIIGVLEGIGVRGSTIGVGIETEGEWDGETDTSTKIIRSSHEVKGTVKRRID